MTLPTRQVCNPPASCNHAPYRDPSSKSLARILLWFFLALMLGLLAAAVDGQEPRQPTAAVDGQEPRQPTARRSKPMHARTIRMLFPSRLGNFNARGPTKRAC
jgi:hypothetical protein